MLYVLSDQNQAKYAKELSKYLKIECVYESLSEFDPTVIDEDDRFFIIADSENINFDMKEFYGCYPTAYSDILLYFVGSLYYKEFNIPVTVNDEVVTYLKKLVSGSAALINVKSLCNKYDLSCMVVIESIKSSNLDYVGDLKNIATNFILFSDISQIQTLSQAVLPDSTIEGVIKMTSIIEHYNKIAKSNVFNA